MSITARTLGTGAGITKVTFWHGVNPPPNRDVLQVLVDRFNQEHPDIQVESLYVGQAGSNYLRFWLRW